MSKTESDLIERHFRSAGYRDASEDHGHPGWVWSGVARPVPAVADLAGTTTLTAELSAALDGVRGPRPRHDPGRVLVDLAVAIANGAEAISDIAVLADQPALFGSVASDSTCRRLLDALGDPELAAVAAARARAREVAWAQRAETTGAAFGPSRVAGTAGVEALVIDLDGHIVVCHSEKEQAAPTFKHTFGLHPLLAYCDNTGEFLAATLHPGNAGSNTAADHIAVLDQALAQNPDAHRHGRPILVRADGADGSKAFLAHIRSLRQHGTATQFSVGWAITAGEPAAIGLLRERDWTPAVDPDGEPCPVIEAAVAELTGLLPAQILAAHRVGLEYSIVVVICVSSLHRGLSGGDVVLVRESAEDVSSADPVLSEVDPRWPGVSLSRCELAEGTVRTGWVVMPQVFGQYTAQMVLIDDQQPVEKPPAQGADDPFADSIRSRRLRWAGENLIPSAMNTASKEPVNWPARSLIRNLTDSAPEPRSIRKLRAAESSTRHPGSW